MEALTEDKFSGEFRKEEWINGLYNFSPAASPAHNKILNELQFLFMLYLKEKDCTLFRENIGLVLADPEKITAKEVSEAEKDTKVRPDLLVFCKSKPVYSGNSIVGVPDFILEVLSPGSVQWDKKIKKEKYLQAGVQEYWIVDFLGEEIIKYFNGIQTVHSFTETLKVDVFSNLSIDFSKLDHHPFQF